MEIIDYIFGQYKEYSTLHIVLEILTVICSIVSVIFSARNSVLVYPFGILGTGIYVYLLFQWELPGDMIINAYYFIMSLYGWYNWSSDLGEEAIPVTRVSQEQWLQSLMIFLGAVIGVYVVYQLLGMLSSYLNYIDIFTTGIFFVGMWQMALRKLEHWLVLLVGNIITIPLYFIKGYSFSAILYIFLAYMAYVGFVEWKKHHLRRNLVASE
ncbi:nicotinamide mononucleotide transporter [Nonlabens spongiae]|uniref:Nicotinamide riboside transporter PnuC n=1 Tax=Nonlabens spongiae TaxID=331648 RepID=A0A1W6MLG0_9FLAO|nr:nicotinamide riboside transporter PnuC [Nonlabens spongiae]ARN78441.1 nicotinamide mononucleotide transporter [Nonlabens spongiae]